MKLSLVIPVYNGGDDFGTCLRAIAAATRRPDELIVVDDGSTDGSPALALQAGAQLVQASGRPQGPAKARNRAMAHCTGEVIVFVDADVAIHPDTLQRIESCLTEHPEIDGLFGSYDDAPPAPSLISRYKNLMHHYVHQHGHQEASTFWSGCGAIRRAALNAVGGFPEHYPKPSIEDIELGMRLRRLGFRVWLCPDIQVTHLKRWTLRSMLQSDILYRALPWGRLIMRGERAPNDLNLTLRSRISGMLAWFFVLLGGFGLAARPLWLGAALSFGALFWLNRGLYRFMASRGGLRLAITALGLHLLYYLYSSAIMAYCILERFLERPFSKSSATKEAGYL